MQCLQTSDWIGIVGILVGIIGIIVGCIGAKSLSIANKNTNKIGIIKNGTVNQAQVINNGLDSYAVIKIAKDTTQEELKEIASKIPQIIEAENVEAALSISKENPNAIVFVPKK